MGSNEGPQGIKTRNKISWPVSPSHQPPLLLTTTASWLPPDASWTQISMNWTP